MLHNEKQAEIKKEDETKRQQELEKHKVGLYNTCRIHFQVLYCQKSSCVNLSTKFVCVIVECLCRTDEWTRSLRTNVC